MGDGVAELLPWSFDKHVRAYNRAFDDERAVLSPIAEIKGANLRWLLWALQGSRATFQHAGTRRDTVKAIDEFLKARKSNG